MKTHFKNFAIALTLILSLSIFVQSCGTTIPASITHPEKNITIVDKKLGDSGLTVIAGTNLNPQQPTAWITLLADLKTVKKSTVKKLESWFPQLAGKLNTNTIWLNMPNKQ